MIMQTQHLNMAAVDNHSAELLVILVPAGQTGFPSQAYPPSLETLIEHYKKMGDWHSQSKYLLCINPPEFKFDDRGSLIDQREGKYSWYRQKTEYVQPWFFNSETLT